MRQNESGETAWYRIAVLGLLLTVCVLATYYFHFVLKMEVVFTHFFYVPIILAGLWWSRRGIAMGVFLALLLLGSHVVSPLETPFGADLARAFMFVVVGAVVGLLNERRLALEAELRAYSKTLEQRTSQLEERTADLEQANIHLLEMDRLKSIFLASMSHELRTPLNSIIGFTGILLQGLAGELNEEQRKQLTMVRDSSRHLLSLINDLLDISKIEAGKARLSLREFGLGDVAREVMGSFAPLASRKGLEICGDIPAGITLYSDQRRLKQVLMNLVGNAVKFTDQGGVNIAARTLEEDGMLEVRVTDTGIGIEDEDMRRIFEPFQQIDMSLTKKYEGTGLGLYLTRKLVFLLGGDISARSECGKGSEFTFTLPLICEEEVE